MMLRDKEHRHLFLTGEKQVGKSTLLRKLLENRAVICGGFYTIRIRKTERNEIYMLRAGKKEECQPENLLFTKKHGKITLVQGRFDQIGSGILKERTGCDLIIMDELGPAESDAAVFQQEVLECLEEDIPIYGVLQSGESEFIEKIKNHRNVHVATVTEENRNELLIRLREQGW